MGLLYCIIRPPILSQTKMSAFAFHDDDRVVNDFYFYALDNPTNLVVH